MRGRARRGGACAGTCVPTVGTGEMTDFETLLIDGWEDEQYQAFVDKFKTKKTSDDCYTPPEIYEAVADWVANTYRVDKADFVRPFYPGGDYERYEYPASCVVVDNPPFSIISGIVRFYSARGIRFFLFAPALTLFSAAAYETCTALPVGVTITYANGAEVPTSFLTNLEPENVCVKTAPELYTIVDKKNRELQKAGKRELPKYVYPDSVLTAAIAQRWCKYGVAYTLRRSDCFRISGLEAQRASGNSIFGGGFLLSTRAAAEKAAAVNWPLTDIENYYISCLDRKADQNEQGSGIQGADGGAGDLG